jgi:PadR family transcriptional regulator, regulatory protein PadR
MFRKPGTLLPLERRLLEVAVGHAERGVYGFALAQELAGEQGETKLVAHGTLYKALDRMRRAGWLTAAWEDPETAETQGRPRRKIYRVTGEGIRALQEAPRVGEGHTGLGEVTG